MQSDCFWSPVAVHDGQCITIQLSAEITAYGCPAVATIRAFKDFIRSEVQGFFLMLTCDQWCIPIPAVRCLLIPRLGLNRSFLSSLFVKANQPAILGLSINYISVVRIGSAFKTVATVGYKPVTIDNTSLVDGLRRAA